MKKKNLTGKLNLSKETISALDNQKLNAVKGGAPKTMIGVCRASYDFGVCPSLNAPC